MCAYTERRCEAAFAELVRRHADFVYSAAVRMVRDAHLAEDVTQAVFVALAQNARPLTDAPILSGWLHRTTRNLAANTIRADVRRRAREQEAAAMHELLSPESDDAWDHIAPQLDATLGELSEGDSAALFLRYFQRRSAQEMAQTLGISEEAAQKRVSRAVERLRACFAKRGLAVGASGLVLVLSANSVHAAPVGLGVSLAAAAFKGSTATATNLTILKSVLKLAGVTKVKTSIAVAVGALLIADTAAVVTNSLEPSGKSGPGSRLRLPVGPGNPSISMGGTHGLILASDGSLWSWGEDFLGWPVLGLGNVATQTSLHRIGQETDWANLASSFTHSLAVKSDGTLWAWGANISHQLGDGTTTTRSTPVPSVEGTDWKQVAAGNSTSFALKGDGTLWAWGDNWAGNVGIGSTIESREAVQIGSRTNWTRVWAGGVQTVGLQSDGSLWFWGSLTGDSTHLLLVPTRVSADTNWAEVGFGYFTILAIKTDGTLWAWGRNAGIHTGRPMQLLNETPVQVGINTDWQACSSSESFSQVLKKKDGSLWALDASEYSVVKASYKPVKLTPIKLQKDIVAFGAAGRGVTGIALTREGEVWTWGKVLGEYTPAYPKLQSLATRMGWKTHRFDRKPVIREEPWQLPNME